jgi:hypothetical protein
MGKSNEKGKDHRRNGKNGKGGEPPSTMEFPPVLMSVPTVEVAQEPEPERKAEAETPLVVNTAEEIKAETPFLVMETPATEMLSPVIAEESKAEATFKEPVKTESRLTKNLPSSILYKEARCHICGKIGLAADTEMEGNREVYTFLNFPIIIDGTIEQEIPVICVSCARANNREIRHRFFQWFKRNFRLPSLVGTLLNQEKIVTARQKAVQAAEQFMEDREIVPDLERRCMVCGKTHGMIEIEIEGFGRFYGHVVIVEAIAGRFESREETQKNVLCRKHREEVYEAAKARGEQAQFGNYDRAMEYFDRQGRIYAAASNAVVARNGNGNNQCQDRKTGTYDQ